MYWLGLFIKRLKPLSELLIIAVILSPLLNGCFLVKKIAGADIDPVQFEKARQSRMMEVRSQSADQLLKRLNSSDPIDNADILVYMTGGFIQKIASQYTGSKGWIDENTNYTVKDVDLKILDGSAIATLGLTAHNDKYNVDVDMTMDCIMTIEMNKNDLVAKLEPFNISPVVTTRGLLASVDEIIKNLIKVNVANLGKNFPELKFPLDFTNKFEVPGTKISIKDKINMNIMNPARKIEYKLRLKEIIFMADRALASVNVENVEVK